MTRPTFSRLASRRQREKEYNVIASAMNISVNAKGRCERDAMVLVSKLYSEYAGALRSEFTADRPAQPVLFLLTARAAPSAAEYHMARLDAPTSCR